MVLHAEALCMTVRRHSHIIGGSITRQKSADSYVGFDLPPLIFDLYNQSLGSHYVSGSWIYAQFCPLLYRFTE